MQDMGLDLSGNGSSETCTVAGDNNITSAPFVLVQLTGVRPVVALYSYVRFITSAAMHRALTVF